MIHRIGGLVVKELIHLRRDWWLPAFMLFGGVLELLLIGWATSRPIANLPLLVVDRDQSAESRRAVQALENTTTFRVWQTSDDLSMVEDSLARGSINAALIIPPGYGSELSSSLGSPTLMVLLNGAESVAATAAKRALDGWSSDLGRRVTLHRLGWDNEALEDFEPSIRIWYNESLNEALYTVPAELGLMLEFTVLVFAALTFSRERELGTLEQLLVMPFSSLEIIAGKAIPTIVIAFIDFVLMLVLVQLFFDVPIRGSLALLLVLALGYLLVELGKGLVISVSARTQHQAFLMVLLVGMVDFMFTGYAAPIESMPRVIQWIGYLVPARHWLAIFRGILLKGAGFDAFWPHVVGLALLGIAIASFSLRYVRKALD